MTQRSPTPRISNQVLELLEYLAQKLLGDSEVLLEQAIAATVVQDSPTMLDVEVPAWTPRLDIPNGPLKGEALVYEGEELVGELLVWVRDGRFIGLEQAWYTDEPPSTWPTPDRVRFE